MSEHLTLIQRLGICFAAGVVGALAVVLFSHLLVRLGIGPALGAKAPISLKSPEIYKPLFWGGLWGLPLGLFIKDVWPSLYLFGSLYFLAPVLALYLFFLPRSGAGFFGLQRGGPLFTLYLLIVNLPYGIVTAMVSRAMMAPP